MSAVALAIAGVEEALKASGLEDAILNQARASLLALIEDIERRLETSSAARHQREDAEFFAQQAKGPKDD